MISSSNFFKKTFFNINHKENQHNLGDQQCGPWTQTIINPTDISLHLPKPKRKRSILEKLHIYVPQAKRSNLLPRGKSMRYDMQQTETQLSYDGKLRLPFIKQNSVSPNLQNNQNNTNVQKSLQIDGRLNFITKNNRGSLKKYTERPKYDTITPRTQVYRRCILAARQHIFEQKKAKFFSP